MMNRYKIYFVLVLLVAMVGLYIQGKDYQNNVDNYHRVTQAVPTKKAATKVGVDLILTSNTKTTTITSVKHINFPEPTNANADMAATGEFADQVNLLVEKDECKELCVDAANVNAPATGEFADQINSGDILKQAMLNNAELPVETKFMDVSADSAPPTELGAYLPPEQ
jgi:hypothetical protein